MLKSLLAVAALIVVHHGAQAQQVMKTGPCLEYKPTPIELVGHLERIDFPGDPTYVDRDGKQQTQPGYYLRIAHPTCTAAKGNYEARTEVTVFQMVLDSATLAAVRPLVDKEVTVHGTIIPATGARPNAPVLMVPELPVLVYMTKP
jgi:hypothetical protein